MGSVRPAVRHPAQINQAIARQTRPSLSRHAKSTGDRIFNPAGYSVRCASEKRHVEFGIVEHERAVADKVQELNYNVFEPLSFLRQHIIRDSGDRGDLGRELPLRSDKVKASCRSKSRFTRIAAISTISCSIGSSPVVSMSAMMNCGGNT
jgi:hypothetical protein